MKAILAIVIPAVFSALIFIIGWLFDSKDIFYLGCSLLYLLPFYLIIVAVVCIIKYFVNHKKQ